MISFPVSNSRFSKAYFTVSSSFLSSCGQPLFSGTPGTFGAFIVFVQYTIAIGVGIRAAVVGNRSGHLHTAIFIIIEPVTIGVWAPKMCKVSVGCSWHIRTLIFSIGNTVIVSIWTPFEGNAKPESVGHSSSPIGNSIFVCIWTAVKLAANSRYSYTSYLLWSHYAVSICVGTTFKRILVPGNIRAVVHTYLRYHRHRDRGIRARNNCLFFLAIIFAVRHSDLCRDRACDHKGLGF
jgi:hypothetical protein